MRFCLFVGGGLVFTAVAVAQPRYRATELGLRSEPFRQLGVWTGWEGDFPTLYTWTHPIAVNSRGQVLGESRALTNPPEGSTQPWVYWLWDGRETRVIQVPQTLFQRQLPVGAVRTDFPFTMLDDGTVIGSTRWFAPTTHNELGEDYWIWRDGHATLISPRGGDYDTVVDGVTLRKSTYVGVSPNGVI
ncbi:MAG TPA: hypothetical protein VFF65_09365, partial [Phycisphaerales bacterium]|nr:hypothetical protein [Phycisphaerales bacterium]